MVSTQRRGDYGYDAPYALVIFGIVGGQRHHRNDRLVEWIEPSSEDRDRVCDH
jgi:hypothetical protein